MIETLSHSQISGAPHRAHQLFSQRYHVFVERLGWEIPTRGYYEFDQYDQDGTDYVLALDDADNLKGSCRLIPTTAKYMLAEVFSPLLGDRSAPRSPSIMELSRFCVAPADDRSRCGSLCPSTMELFAGMVDFARQNGADEVYAVVTIPVLRIIQRLIGHPPKWRGPVHDIGGFKSVAVSFQATPDIVSRLCDSLGSPLRWSNAPASPTVRRAA